jgi:hypothetical protein
MKKLIPYIALIPLVVLALTPPWQFNLTCDVNSLLWLWTVLISGFLSFAFLYTKTSNWLKLFVVWAFLSCFLSRAPFISFTMYWTLIACAYYYVLCKKIEDWTPVKKAVQAIFLLTSFMIILQLFGKDTLLNFKQPDARILGTVGNDMMESSFVCVLAPFLIINPLNWIPLWLIAFISHSTGAVLALGLGSATLLWVKVKRARIAIVALFIGILVYTGINGDIKTFFSKAGRGPVWKKTVELIAKKPMGHGIATYKVLFPYMCGAEIRDQAPGQEWNTSHNDFLQIPFEVGIPGTLLLFGWIVSILRKLRDPIKIAGLMILSGVMLVHFPMRLNQTVLVMIMFLAYLEGEPCNTSS